MYNTRNSGSIRKRSNGTYEYRIYVNKKPKSFYGKTEAEVKRKCREYLKNYEENKEDEKCSDNIILEDFLEYWLKTYKYGTIADSTYDRLENIYYKHIKTSSIAKKKISDITTDEVQFLINSKKQSLSISSLKKIKEVLYPCFKYAKNTNLIPQNPIENVVIPKIAHEEKEKKTSFYSEQEINLIANAMSPRYYQINPRRYRYAPLYTFILNTGLRIGECMALKWEDVNYNNKTLKVNKSVTIYYERDNNINKTTKKQHVGNTKTLKGNRVLPLNDSAIYCLKVMEQRNKDIDIDSDLIFSNYQGDLLNIKSVQTTFKNICDDIGVEYKGLHALRHTFGSMLIKKHIDIKVVSELLGHTDVRFTYNRYIHIIQEQKAEAINMIEITPNCI